jgi:hypothetical protein
MAYITEYGNWGHDEVLYFEKDLLTEEQWALVAILPDMEKIKYATAIFKEEDLSKWEDQK